MTGRRSRWSASKASSLGFVALAIAALDSASPDPVAAQPSADGTRPGPGTRRRTERRPDTGAAQPGAVLPFVRAEPALLTRAEAAFRKAETLASGGGPVFSGSACGGCHGRPALGGAGPVTERRFGLFERGAFDPLEHRGGSVLQLASAGTFDNPNLPEASRGSCSSLSPTTCCVPTESEPPEANVRGVGRRTQPLFGLGLVDALPDSFFEELAAAQPPEIRGAVRWVPVLVPNPGDPEQSPGSLRVGRFGWKGNVPSLLQFSADAYLNEMGITTQSCFEGTPLTAFAVELAPNGVPMPDGCDDLAPRQTGPNPGGLDAEQWAQVDDAVGSCDGRRTAIQEDVFLFAAFMTALAPPPRGMSPPGGEKLFRDIGCAGCHSDVAFRTPALPAPIVSGDGTHGAQVPGDFEFRPYSDFLLHDMGNLGDGIGVRAGDDALATRQMRTQPLWGNRFQESFLHDGRCTDLGCAILAHDGQAAAARDAFRALGDADQTRLLQFVRSL